MPQKLKKSVIEIQSNQSKTNMLEINPKFSFYIEKDYKMTGYDTVQIKHTELFAFIEIKPAFLCD